MNILFVSSEATPFAKTGGLADVSSALPIALSRLGHNVSVIIPSYSQAEASGLPIEQTNVVLEVPIGKKIKKGTFLKSRLPNSDVPVYLVKHDAYFHRDGLYNSQGSDYSDNCERFTFFCRAALEAVRLLNLDTDIVHANDWQTGLIPALLEVAYKKRSRFTEKTHGDHSMFGEFEEESNVAPEELSIYDKIHSVFTIHNMRHQGRFSNWDMKLTGLDWSYFTYDLMEFYGQLNLLKTGIIFSDKVTTVSPTYAKEIQTEPFGEKLHGVLQYRSRDLSGILNGIDMNEWNPETDRCLAAQYNVQTVLKNKPKCKQALQKKMGLYENPYVPLLGIVSRFDSQKGLHLIAALAESWIEHYGVQFAVLGTGDPELEKQYQKLAERFPNNFAVQLKFSNALSHEIEAGADIFLMPSCYEPCGLNQMYSLRYGTLPIVRLTGGLADTVVNASLESIQDKTANGFTFYWGKTDDLNKAFDWAMNCYFNMKPEWNQMMVTAMQHDWSWKQSGQKYIALYQSLLQNFAAKTLD